MKEKIPYSFKIFSVNNSEIFNGLVLNYNKG